MRHRVLRHVVLLALALAGAAAPAAVAEPTDNVLRPALSGTLATGYASTCVVTETGGVSCWGANDEGQLGDGSRTPSPVPRAVDLSALGDRRARSVVVGAEHACALFEDGAVACWGENAEGQLGTGDSGVDHVTPALVTLPAGTVVRQLAAAYQATCALTTAGAVLCWGSFPLGVASLDARPSALDPARPALPGPVTGIAAGAAHFCALLEDTRAICWGQSLRGELGEGTYEGGPFPDGGSFVREPGLPVSTTGPVVDPALTAPVALTGIRGLSADFRDSCALLAGGSMRCWGANSANMDGGVNTGTHIYAFDEFRLPAGSTAVASGAGATVNCALLDSTRVACAGDSPTGQLGQGSTSFSGVPLLVPFTASGTGARALSVGNSHACVLLSAGAVRCWGANSVGQLGNGQMTARGDDPGEMGDNLPAADVRAPLWRNEADLSVTVDPAAPSIVSGQTGELTVTVRNAGPDPADPSLSFDLPGVDVESATPGSGTYDGRRWRPGALAAGASATFALRLGAGRAGTRTLVAEVETTGGHAIDSDSSPGNGLPEDDRGTATLTVTPAPAAATGTGTDVGGGGGGTGGTGATGGGSGGTGTGAGGGTITKVGPGTLVLSARAARDRRAPYVFAITAALRITAAAPQAACRGTVALTLRRGARRVAARSAALGLRDGLCVARASLRLPRSARAGGYRAEASFAGNDLLTGTTARTLKLRAG